jgi:hypothetical protein
VVFKISSYRGMEDLTKIIIKLEIINQFDNSNIL